MFFLSWLVDAFVQFFGITEPAPRQRRQAGLFIVLLLMVALALLILVATTGYRLLYPVHLGAK